jgi:hypothetical protein
MGPILATWGVLSLVLAKWGSLIIKHLLAAGGELCYLDDVTGEAAELIAEEQAGGFRRSLKPK